MHAWPTRDDFLERISGWLEVSPPLNPEGCARAVSGAIARHVQPREVEEVKQTLPVPIRQLFPAS